MALMALPNCSIQTKEYKLHLLLKSFQKVTYISINHRQGHFIARLTHSVDNKIEALSQIKFIKPSLSWKIINDKYSSNLLRYSCLNFETNMESPRVCRQRLDLNLTSKNLVIMFLFRSKDSQPTQFHSVFNYIHSLYCQERILLNYSNFY